MARGKHYGAAAELARKLYGGDLVEFEEIESVGTSVEVLLTNDPERVFMFLINLGSTTVFLRTLGVPAVNSGIRLSAQGGSLSFSADRDGPMPTKEFKAIADTAASDVYVLTLRRDRATPQE